MKGLLQDIPQALQLPLKIGGMMIITRKKELSIQPY